MKYKEIKKGLNKGLWENEDGVVYTEDVAKIRMANPDAYDPKPKKKDEKKPRFKANPLPQGQESNS